MEVSPSFARPPAPRLLFGGLPGSFESFSIPVGPLVGIAILPPHPFFSVLAQDFYYFLSGISATSSSALSCLGSKFIRWAAFEHSFRSLFFV